MENIIITGGCGFIGTAVIEKFIKSSNYNIIVVDKLSYASNTYIIDKYSSSLKFYKEDISNRYFLRYLLREYNPIGIINIAAETHVDNSIASPRPFLESNVVGVFELLEAIRAYRDEEKKSVFFYQVSTDEVFGDIEEGKFSEISNYNPSSPYSATKAAADHLVRAWNRTYNIKTIISNCSNNYGPHQHTEKLIPLMINRAINDEPMPIYGAGDQIRDWLFVEDHADAIYKIFQFGNSGETFCVGGNNELTNLQVVYKICDIVERLTGLSNRRDLITFVEDRPGHDFRYAIDATRIEEELDWQPKHSFDQGLEKTVQWYLENLSFR